MTFKITILKASEINGVYFLWAMILLAFSVLVLSLTICRVLFAQRRKRKPKKELSKRDKLVNSINNDSDFSDDLYENVL